ncbi:MAG: hypothetical protein N3D11_16635, partial [Candidatus Sumerlaeia bacterium]|nr:hypothetical protein [Candidatus Sumerlaeia bacterium]
MFAAGISGATESLLRAERPPKSAQQLYTEGVVVGDEAFLYLPVASTFDRASGRYGARTFFRYRDGSDPVPVLSLSEAKVYSAAFSAKMAYDPVSGRFAAAGQVTGSVGANTNPIVVIDPGPTAKVHVVSRNGRLNGRPVFSPDGQWLAFLSSPADAWDWEHRSVKGLTLRVIHLATLKETELSPAAFNDIPTGAPVWSPDSKWIAYAASFHPKTRRIHVVQPDGRGFRTLAPNEPYSVSNLVWPTPNDLLFTRIGTHGIYRISLDSEQVSIFKSGPFSGELELSPDGSQIMASTTDRLTGQKTTHYLDLQGAEVP